MLCLGLICQLDRSCEPSPTGARRALAVEVHGGDGLAEVEAACEAARVEVLAHLRRKHRSTPQLLVQHQHDPVDAHGGAWALVWHDFSSCNFIK